MAFALDPPFALPDAPVRRRRSWKAWAIACALGLHALLLIAVLSAREPVAAFERPATAVELPPAPVPLVPPPQTRQTHAGGSPAPAPRLARPSTPAPRPSLAPPQTIRPPAPVPMLPAPTPTLLAPRGPDLASPVTGAGAGAATGGSGAGAGTGPGGPGSLASSEPVWVDSPGPDEVERAYPLAAYRAGRGGSVELACTELKDGRVKGCRVSSQDPLQDGFGPAAVKLSRRFRFRPVVVDGRAVEAPIAIPYDFSVE